MKILRLRAYCYPIERKDNVLFDKYGLHNGDSPCCAGTVPVVQGLSPLCILRTAGC